MRMQWHFFIWPAAGRRMALLLKIVLAADGNCFMSSAMKTFAKFVSGQGAKMRNRLADILSSGDQEPISKPKPYIKPVFPEDL